MNAVVDLARSKLEHLFCHLSKDDLRLIRFFKHLAKSIFISFFLAYPLKAKIP